MAEIDATTTSTSTVISVTATVTSYTTIADPAAYVAQVDIYTEILSRAGLDEDLIYISAALQSTQTIGGLHIYTLLVKFGDSAISVAGDHTHDKDTITFPLRESYRDGPTIDLDATLGPVLITYDDATSTDFFRIRSGTSTLRDHFYVKANGLIRFGSHLEFSPDATYDIGTPDGGTTNLRPRDFRLSRDLYAGRNIAASGYGDFSSYLRATYNQFVAQGTNPNTGPTLRHIYVNSTDDSLRYWDGVAETILGAGPSASDTVNLWDCNVNVSVLDVVYWTAPGTVDRATATNMYPDKSALGLCVSKPTGTTCYVKHLGELTGFGGSLTPGKRYYVSRTVSGGLTDDITTLQTGDLQQAVGTAKDDSTLLILLERPLTL